MKIYVFQNGGAVLKDENDPNHVQIGSEKPTEILEATDENIKKYFGDPQTVKDVLSSVLE